MWLLPRQEAVGGFLHFRGLAASHLFQGLELPTVLASELLKFSWTRFSSRKPTYVPWSKDGMQRYTYIYMYIYIYIYINIYYHIEVYMYIVYGHPSHIGNPGNLGI